MIAQHGWVKWWMLFEKRQYVIHKIKKPLMGAIINLSERTSWLGMLIALIQIVRIARRYPEPTKENTSLPRTHILIDVRDWFFEHEDNPGRDALFRAMWRMFIIEYEHDGYYTPRIDGITEEMQKRGWGIRSIKTSMSHWKE